MDTGDVRLDVRAIPRSERHPRIFAAYDALANEQALVLLSDHEPRPLHVQFEERHAKRFAWEQRQLGDGRWEVRITKVALPAADASPAAVLRRTAVFAHLDDRTIDQLAHRSRRTAIKRHHAVVEQGVLWPYFGIVESGIVQAILVTPLGREQAMYDVLAGETFGEAPLLDSGHVPLRHIALTADTRVLLLPADLVREILAREPLLARALEKRLAQRMRAVLERFGGQLWQSATARVAQALLPYAAPETGLCDALPPLPTMTQTELALSAGTVKEVVSRALAELEASGAVQREGGHIVRLDRDKLAAKVASEQ